MAECFDPQAMNTGYQELVNNIMGRVCQSKLVNIGKGNKYRLWLSKISLLVLPLQV